MCTYKRESTKCLPSVPIPGMRVCKALIPWAMPEVEMWYINRGIQEGRNGFPPGFTSLSVQTFIAFTSYKQTLEECREIWWMQRRYTFTQPNKNIWRPARATFLAVLPLVFMLPFKEDLGGGGDGKKIQEKAHAAAALHIIGDNVNFRPWDGKEKMLLHLDSVGEIAPLSSICIFC